ncbi:DUF3445 domain-containing protein [Rhodosalinus sediminis]|uniref:DUF3445 domain-containing protein n=1 Tax=Rhodosalinus sediminis TaxID=1940533 RepID=A0A3D9BZS9_9RHOB|nr:DUF3445 domain-containing protein [Rhodosalinus sediminis]REC58851.1 DUF3445 domain-containing protein [Rhodosalinus sediminis]
MRHEGQGHDPEAAQAARAGTDAPVLQRRIPFDTTAPRLPGTAPLDPAAWLLADEAFAAQMALRDWLIGERRDAVIRLDPAARPAAEELLEVTLAHLATRPGYRIDGARVLRPDGVSVPLDRGDPMATLGRLAQEDFCLMEKRGAEHVLTAAVLCFPASWTLSQKFLRPLLRIHAPVAEYDAALARRVQRLFDGVQPGRPLWRFNLLAYDDPALFQPRREGEARAAAPDAGYLRAERQCILRLPATRAVAFTIHTWVVARGSDEAGEAGHHA